MELVPLSKNCIKVLGRECKGERVGKGEFVTFREMHFGPCASRFGYGTLRN